ncbi:P1 family peptidase [Kiloniella antarctica]|uniref:P1 family peptidase n=1 Tax=Kiloniella antarctica TaxID=1550907 RepID=A0ABW5BEV9_9PROT
MDLIDCEIFDNLAFDIENKALSLLVLIDGIMVKIMVEKRRRFRDLGVEIGTLPTGQYNAITDVSGVEVGHCTVIQDNPNTLRTGVTAILPLGRNKVWSHGLFAGCSVFNGYGEMTGRGWLEEAGQLSSPILLTSYYGVGAVHRGINQLCDDIDIHSGTHPIVAETWDGWLSDPNAFALTTEHVEKALNDADSGPVEEGCVGGGTGMVCHDFKAGIGTSSRKVEIEGETYTLGVLVQANYGDRSDFRVNGVSVGAKIPASEVPVPDRKKVPHTEDGSIIIVVATDAPLLSKQCDRLAKRAVLGLGRAGGFGHNGSGDYVVAFSTGNILNLREEGLHQDIKALPEKDINLLFHAVVEATEEAIVNSVCQATTTEGYKGRVVYELPLEVLKSIMSSE